MRAIYVDKTRDLHPIGLAASETNRPDVLDELIEFICVDYVHDPALVTLTHVSISVSI